MSVKIGNIRIGDNYPVVVQSMTNTPTNDVDATVEQCIRIAGAGGKIIRITVQNLQEVESLGKIREQLLTLGYDFPLVADVHFNPRIAEEAAKIVEKVRINPGNYTDKRFTENYSFTGTEYHNGLTRLRENLRPLLDICKNYGTALRVGVNHGSLSGRIMHRYGNTPEGMAESAMDFIRICTDEGFKNLVISMKASNTRIMVYATRLLMEKMEKEGLQYPVHLGVTEAGTGMEGRIRSAVGIAALLQERTGDTLRVSLTEDPEDEIPVAAELAGYFSRKKEKYSDIAFKQNKITSYTRRKTTALLNIGGNNPPVVIASLDVFKKDPCVRKNKSLQIPDFLFTDALPDPLPDMPEKSFIVPFKNLPSQENTAVYPIGNCDECKEYLSAKKRPFFLLIPSVDISHREIDLIENCKENIIVIADCISSPAPDVIHRFFYLLEQHVPGVPVIIRKRFNLPREEQLILRAAGETGLFFISGLADGLWLENTGRNMPLITYSFEILQAAGARISSTEYISCPSCGRTQFDIKKVLHIIKAATSHLTGLKIAVMGCIVNGPGEMADADYGFVGAGNGKITLYRGKTPVIKNVPEYEAVQHLVSLIKNDGKWTGA